ncbi:MAG: hypothetical protein K8R21_16525, partial [Leptospira sp.]|nr:hypothetical protein [Leptospira sp.]
MTQDNKSNRSNEENEFDLIRGQIENDKEVVIILYTLTEYTEQKMQSVLRWVLQKYQKEELYNSMYSVLFEVVVNGTRANIKKLFFEEQGLDITNNQDYSEGMKLFKEKITK